MPSQPDSLLSYLRVLVASWQNDPRGDDELVARYVENRDEAAFASLVGRHGQLVWRTCRHILGDTPDVEDAFQTTFLAMSRKAGKFPVKSMAGWLHRVARQTALNAKIKDQRCQKREHNLRNIIQPKSEDSNRTELYAAVDQELEGLPERLRVPILLHYIEGKSQAEVARILGCARSALQKRLAKGEAILREQLEQRGLALGTVSVAALLGNTVGGSAMPASLVASTAKAAVAFRAGTLGGMTAEAAENLLRTLAAKKAMRIGWWLVIASIGLLGISGGSIAVWKVTCEDKSGTDKSEMSAVPTVTEFAVEPQNKRVDLHGDPLPEGALARIGTLRFRPGGSSIAFLPDNKTLISAGGGTVRFWEAFTGKELRRLEGLKGGEGKIAFSLDGKKLALSNLDDKSVDVSVWDLTVSPLRMLWQKILPASIGTQTSMAFSSNGRSLVVTANGETRLFDVFHDNVRPIKGDSSSNVLAFSLDGSILAIGYTLWDVSTGKKLLSLKNSKKDSNLVYSTFSFDGKTLITGEFLKGKDNNWNRHELDVWDVKTGTKICQTTPSDYQPPPAFIPDENTLLIANTDNIHCLNFRTGKLEPMTKITLSHSNPDTWGERCISSDGKLLAATYGQGEYISVWSVATGQEVVPTGIHRGVIDLAFAPNGEHIATLSSTNDLQLWKANTGQSGQKLERYGRVLMPPLNYTSTDWIELHTPNPIGQEVLVRWDTRSGKVFHITAPLGAPPLPAKSESDIVYGHAVSSNGRWQLWSSKDAVLSLVDQLTKQVVRSFSTNHSDGEPLRSVAISADGRTILCSYPVRDVQQLITSYQIEVWSSVTSKQLMGIEVKTLPGKDLSDKDATVSLSPDGRHVAVASSEENVVHLWEVASVAEAGKFNTAGIVDCVAWSPDGSLLACGTKTGVLHVWSMETKQEVHRFTGHRGAAISLAFSSDGIRLASGSKDSTVLVWDLRGSRKEAKAQPSDSVEDAWSILQQKDAVKSWSAQRLLIRNPDATLRLLRHRLVKLTPCSDPTQVAMLLARLDDDVFQVRKQAEEQLEKMGTSILPDLRRVLAKKPSLEAGARVDRLMEKIRPSGQGILDPIELQIYRGIEVLERIGTPAAVQILEELSRLPSESVQAEEAKFALQRLSNR